MLRVSVLIDARIATYFQARRTLLEVLIEARIIDNFLESPGFLFC
jgi:hypothetical protein